MNQNVKLVAVLTKTNLNTNWGFSFNTDEISLVNEFMSTIHFDINEFSIFKEAEKPTGVYTYVEINPRYNIIRELTEINYKIVTFFN